MYPIPLKQLSHLTTLIFLLFHLAGSAQPTIQQDTRVDPLLKQVDAKRPGLVMFSRKADRGQYVNMAVLADSNRILTWFTCHGQAFDAIRLPDVVYSRIKSGDLNPFSYYKDYFSDLLSHVRGASALFRQKGLAALKDTGSIYHRVYTYPPVQLAQSTLQKEVAMEKMMSDLCLQLSLFDNRTPQQLHPNDSFQLRFQMAGKMIRKGDTITYYNANTLSSASRIVLSKHAPGKMFVYDRQGQLADSVPLKAGKYAALLNEKEDVFLLYRGWLELQSQQAIAGKEEVARLLNREYTMLYKPAYWGQHKQELEQTLLEVQEQVDVLGNKVMGLIVPASEETEHLLAAVYQDKPAEITYTRAIGFMYSIVYLRGYKRYELTDHRGNVMAVVSDRKKGVDENGDGSIEYYNADVVSAVDYLPFGGQMPGRTYSGDDKHRYGYNGKENDNEVKGEGNSLDFGARIYDPRIGRFLSVDPLAKNFPDETHYGFAGNSPLMLVDHNGMFKISPLFAKRYPTLAKIIKYYLPLLKDNPEIRNAWIENSGFKDAEAGGKIFDEMVTYGKGLWITPTRPMEEAKTDRIPLLSQFFEPANGAGEYNERNYPENLSLQSDQLANLEAAVKKGKTEDISEAMFIVTSTIMHEVAHYGRVLTGKPDTDYRIEGGAQFEEKAFGTRFGYRHPLVADLSLQNRDMTVLKGWFKENNGKTKTFGLSLSPNYYNYYNSVKNALVPEGQKGDPTLIDNGDEKREP